MHLASVSHVVGIHELASVVNQGLQNDGIVFFVVHVLMCSLWRSNYEPLRALVQVGNPILSKTAIISGTLFMPTTFG